jgi:transcriptional regulator with XRE-family HTH domain
MASHHAGEFDELIQRIDAEAQEEGPSGVAHLRALQFKYRMINLLLQERRQLGWTQEQLAERSGIGQTEISKIERGRKSPTLDTYARLAAALGMEPIVPSRSPARRPGTHDRRPVAGVTGAIRGGGGQARRSGDAFADVLVHDRTRG